MTMILYLALIAFAFVLLPAAFFVGLVIYLQVTGIVPRGVCRVCGCTDTDCRACIARTGEPCSWIDEEHTICSRCVDYLEAGDLASVESGDLLSPDCSPLNAKRDSNRGLRGSRG